MKKDGKRITRWKTGATKLQGAAYLKEMAEQGWILEDMNHLTYSFREDEPQYLKYRLEERETVLTEEERAKYEKEGWTEVCHYELEYVFVKERDPFEEDVEENKAEILRDLKEQIEREEKTERSARQGQLIVIGFGLIVALLVMGFSEGTMIFGVRILVRFLPWILIAYFVSKRRTKKLLQEQDRVREGDISDEYTDWRKSRRVTILSVLALIIVFGVWIYYQSDFNEKTFDMPKEVSYAEIPAVRLENLIDEPLTRSGDSIDPDMEGFRVNPDMFAGSMYTIKKNMGGFDNYGVDHRYLFKTKEKMETHQCMKTADGTEYKLNTMYYCFRDLQDAGKEYSFLVRNEESMEDSMKALEMDFPENNLIVLETEQFQNLHMCKREWTHGTAYHIVCHGIGCQVMEVDFYYSNGEVTERDLLKEIKKVFHTQFYE